MTRPELAQVLSQLENPIIKMWLKNYWEKKWIQNRFCDEKFTRNWKCRTTNPKLLERNREILRLLKHMDRYAVAIQVGVSDAVVEQVCRYGIRQRKAKRDDAD